MMTTHDSMRIPGVSRQGFTLWKAVEVNVLSPLYLVTVRYGADTEALGLMFSSDHELVSFFTNNVDATPLTLDILALGGADGSKATRLMAVSTLALHQPGPTADVMAVLQLDNGQTVRARDLAPYEAVVNGPMLLVAFTVPGSR